MVLRFALLALRFSAWSPLVISVLSDISYMPDLASILDSFVRKRILIVGEISAAKCGEFTNSSKEAPPASAALIALYASSLGAAVSLVGSIGPDLAGNQIINILRDKNVNVGGVTIDPIKPTLCWKKCHEGTDNTALNMITEKQIIEAALKQALNARALLYVCQSRASFSSKLYKELKKVSLGLKIPMAVFSRLPFPSPNGFKGKNDLFLTYNQKETKLSKELCANIKASECIVFDKNNGFSQVNRKQIRHCTSKTKVDLYQYEAAISAMAVLLLACHQYPSYLPQMAKNMRLNNNHMSVSLEAGVRSPEI